LGKFYQKILDFFSANPARYNLIHIVLLFGLPYVRVARMIGARAGDKVLDLGCGPAQILSRLDEGVQYLGVDENPAHIEFAKKKYSQRKARFVSSNVFDIDLEKEGPFDKVLMLGFMHHLPDEALDRILEYLSHHVKGQLITFDPVRTAYHPISNLLCSLDKGNQVRNAEQYRAFLSNHFNISESVVFPARSLAEMFAVSVCEPKEP